MRKLPIEDHELGKVKTEIKKEAYPSFDNYYFWNESPGDYIKRPGQIIVSE